MYGRENYGEGQAKTVVHLITELNTGGAERMLLKLLSALNGNRFRHIVVSMQDKGTQGRSIEALGVELHTLGMSPGRPSLKSLMRLIRLLSHVRPDVLQTWLYHADLMGFVAGKLARVPRVAWNIRCSELDREKYWDVSTLLVPVLSILSRWVNVAIVNSGEGMAYHKRRGYRPKNWCLIPNGFDLEEFRPDPGAPLFLQESLGIPPGSVLVGVVARFDPAKNHLGFLEAAGAVRREYPHAWFVLAGKGITRENRVIVDEIDRQDLGDRISLLGERKDIPQIMAGLDVFVSSSASSEGTSNVIGEAMSCGVPCVATEVGNSALLIGNVGCVVRPNDVAALAAAVMELIAMEGDERKLLGEAARSRIRERFHLPVIACEYDRVYRGLAGEKMPAES